MELHLEGKHALITEGNSGIGEGIAVSLAREGVVVVVHGRDRNMSQRVVEAIQVQGGHAFVVEGDLGTDEGAQQVVSQALEAVGNIDILVNYAGLFGTQGWLKATSQEWATMYSGNVLVAVRLIKLVSEQMKARKFGRILQMASYEAEQPTSAFPIYAAATAALVNLTLSLSKELAGTGITVNAVSPGLILTENLKAVYLRKATQLGWGEDWSEIEKRMVRRAFPNTTERIGTVEDVASLVTFLASPLAGFINGVNHRVDGGYLGML